MNNLTCHKIGGYPTISEITKTKKYIQHQLEYRKKKKKKKKTMDINK